MEIGVLVYWCCTRLRIFLEVNCVVGNRLLVIGHWEKVECVKMFIGSANQPLGSANLFAPNDKLAKIAGTSSRFRDGKLTFKFRFLFSAMLKPRFRQESKIMFLKLIGLSSSSPNTPIYQIRSFTDESINHH
jgi:hypothetical protein